MRGETTIAELCRKESIHQANYYKWSKVFMEAGKRRLNGDTMREANTSEVHELKGENGTLKELVADKEPKETILLYCKSFKSIAIGDETNKGFFGGYNSYVLSDEPYKNALVKINENN